MKKFLLLFPLVLLADINPFNVPIDNSTYNALTPQEKQILKNKNDIVFLKKELNDLKKNLNNINIKIVSYDETLDNIKQKLAAFNTILSEIDVVRGDVNRLKREYNLTRDDINKINEKIKNIENNLTSMQGEINNIKNAIKVMSDIQNKNFLYLKQSINTILKELKNQTKQTQISPKKAFLKAKELYKKGEFNKAREYFLYTLSKNYLPATSSFYLGEIAYKQKKYKEALGYYKKSVDIYPKKTSFTKTLLYHTGMSFEKLGNKKAAEITFKKLIKDYPSSNFAKLAKKELEKLK